MIVRRNITKRDRARAVACLLANCTFRITSGHRRAILRALRSDGAPAMNPTDDVLIELMGEAIAAAAGMRTRMPMPLAYWEAECALRALRDAGYEVQPSDGQRGGDDG